MHCQLCLMELDALGNHPQNNCPVYTQQPVSGVSSDVVMELNLTQLKDLEYICQLAEDHVAEEYRWKSAAEQEWLERIRKYRTLLRKEIATIEPTLS